MASLSGKRILHDQPWSRYLQRGPDDEGHDAQRAEREVPVDPRLRDHVHRRDGERRARQLRRQLQRNQIYEKVFMSFLFLRSEHLTNAAHPKSATSG